MIMIHDLYEDQLAQLSLRWVPLSEMYDEADLDGVDGSLEVICYDGRYTLDPLLIFELERMINEGATRDQMLQLLRDFVVDCETAGWLMNEGNDDLHVWGQLRVGMDDHGGLTLG